MRQRPTIKQVDGPPVTFLEKHKCEVKVKGGGSGSYRIYVTPKGNIVCEKQSSGPSKVCIIKQGPLGSDVNFAKEITSFFGWSEESIALYKQVNNLGLSFKIEVLIEVD